MIRPCALISLSLSFLVAGAFPARAVELIPADGETRPPKELPKDLESIRVKRPLPPLPPPPVLLLIKPLKRGMFIRLPIVDTDPNRGVTYGLMPIWVIKGRKEDRIEHIFAPSLTYNQHFQATPTFRYFRYPTGKSAYSVRGSVTKFENREAMGEMEDLDFLGRGIAVGARVQYDVDGSKRFYGIGADTAEAGETNFTSKVLQLKARVGLPIFEGSGVKFNIAHHFAGQAIAAGVINTIPDIGLTFPQHTPARWHQDSEVQLFVDYDTRDDQTTTTRGSYAKFMIENSQRPFGSEFVFQRYGIDLRHFRATLPGAKHVTAGRFRYEQLVGDAPFYLMPSLGGKELHRAYGEGRYIEKGMFTATLEQRLTAYSIKMAGVSTDLEIAPFAGVGTVFRSPKRAAAKTLRPVYGVAFRAIARPQVVGSVDLGLGQEGAAVFMDIGYSF